MSRQGDEHFMFINSKRVFYAGLLGKPQKRQCGAFIIYVSLDGEFAFIRDDGVESCANIALIPPYAAHSLKGDARFILAIAIEPESVAPDVFTEWMEEALNGVQGRLIAERIRRAYYHLRERGDGAIFSENTEEFDQSLFGEIMKPRVLDPRIQAAAERLYNIAEAPRSAECYAVNAQLSLSRFLHLFKEETGVSFRDFRAWKRARSLLYFVNQDINLACLAQDIGYPDSTHFSHSIRRFYGLQPRSIFLGSRSLKIWQH